MTDLDPSENVTHSDVVESFEVAQVLISRVSDDDLRSTFHALSKFHAQLTLLNAQKIESVHKAIVELGRIQKFAVDVLALLDGVTAEHAAMLELLGSSVSSVDQGVLEKFASSSRTNSTKIRELLEDTVYGPVDVVLAEMETLLEEQDGGS